MFLSDYHSHSLVSFDGKFPMIDMAQAAVAGGLNELCITDHCDFLDENGVPVRTYDWDKALAEYDAARLSTLTPEEREQFAALSQKVQASLRQSLRHFCPEP